MTKDIKQQPINPNKLTSLESDNQNISNRMKSSASWLYVQGAIQAVVQFAAGIILARLLLPSDFGVFQAATAFLNIIQIQVVFGIPSAMLQAKSLSRSQWNSAFWMMEGMAVICTVITFLCSSYLQTFYEDTRFTFILRCMCINFFILPYMSINGNMLRKQLNYSIISKIQIVVTFLTILISLILAVLGFGPYCFVVSGLLSSLLSTIFMSFKAPWKPYISFKFAELKSLVRYGFVMHVNKSIDLFANRVDNMMIGSILGAASLGIYNRAYNLSRMPVVEITSRLFQLFFTGFSKIQDDLAYSLTMFHKILCTMALVVYPFLVVFLINGEAFIASLYGAKWLPAAMPLKVMAWGSFFIVISTTMGALSNAQNLILKETPIMVFKALSTIFIVLFCSQWGLTGISIGISIRAVLIAFLMQRMMQMSHLNIKLFDVLYSLSPAITASILSYTLGSGMGLVVSDVLSETSFLHFLFVCITVFAVYLSSLFILGRFYPSHDALQGSLNMFRDQYRSLMSKLSIVRR